MADAVDGAGSGTAGRSAGSSARRQQEAALETVESYLLTPLVQQRSVELPPALTITAQVLLGVLLGALGLMFATPLTAAVMVLVRKLYVEDVLGDAG